MLLKGVRLVTFDVTNTLLHFRKPPARFYKEIGAFYGVHVDEKKTSEQFKLAYKRLSHEHPNFGRGTLGWENWWRSVVRQTFRGSTAVQDDLLEDVCTRLIEAYRTSEAWEVSEGCDVLLGLIRDTGATVGVISNFDPRLDEILSNLGIRWHFDFVLDSYTAGVMKPHPDIFAKALRVSRMSGVVPREALHIGDDYRNDFSGARDSGWRSAMVGGKKTPEIHNGEGPWEFSSLIELCNYIQTRDFL